MTSLLPRKELISARSSKCVHLTEPLFPPGSETIESPICSTPDSRRPITLTTLALDPFEISEIDSRKGSSIAREGMSSDSALDDSQKTHQGIAAEMDLYTTTTDFFQIEKQGSPR